MARKNCQIWAGTLFFCPWCALVYKCMNLMEICFDELLPGWTFVQIALCWISESNCLCVFQHTLSPPDEEQVPVAQSCRIYFITEFSQEGDYSKIVLLLQGSLLTKTSCSPSGDNTQGACSRGTCRWEPGQLMGDLGALDVYICSSLLERCLHVQKACSVNLPDWAQTLQDKEA